MDANNILEELQTLYPEDLNKDYNCYWWYTRNTDGSAILNYINLEDLIDDQLGRTGNDNATVSDTKLQGRRDTHKEEEQREIQCSKEENR